MFKPEDFEMPLEKQLRLRVVEKEVDECDDVKELKAQLKQCVKQLMNYQHLLGKACEYNLEAFMTDWLSTMGIETKTNKDG